MRSCCTPGRRALSAWSSRWSTALRAETPNGLVAVDGDLVCALLPGGPDDELFGLAERVARAGRGGDRVGAGLPAGAGRAVPAGRARETFHEARCALEARLLGAAGTSNGDGAHPLTTYRDLGSFALLLSLQDSDALRLFCESMLGPIEADEGHYGGELVRSLEAFIECNGQWEAAARRLFCHRHTLRYRMRKVEELTGRDLSSARDRIEFWLALRGRELRDGRRPSHSAAASSLSQISLRVGKLGTACQSRSSGTSPTIAIVAAWTNSATSAPVNVAPTRTRRSSSTTIRAVPGHVAADERRAGGRVHVHVDRARVDAGVLRGGQRVADGGDLRLGEDDARGQRPAVDDRACRVARPRMWSAAMRAWYLPSCVEQRAAVDVADRVEPVLGAGDAQMLVGRSGRRRRGRRSRGRARRVRPPPGGDEDLVAVHGVAVRRARRVTSPPSRATRAAVRADAARRRRRAQRVLRPARRRTAPRGRAAAASGSTSVTVAAERAERLRELAPDDAAAEHEQPRRHGVRDASPRGSSTARASARPGTGGSAAVAAGGDDDGAPRDEQLVPDAHAPLAVELAAPAHAARRRAARATAAARCRRRSWIDLVTPRERGAHVELAGHRLAAPGTRRASAIACAGRSSAFDGMHA